MDHVKIISRIQKFVFATEANECLTDDMNAKPRQEEDSDQNDQNKVINLDNDEEEEKIYQFFVPLAK